MEEEVKYKFRCKLLVNRYFPKLQARFLVAWVDKRPKLFLRHKTYIYEEYQSKQSTYILSMGKLVIAFYTIELTR